MGLKRYKVRVHHDKGFTNIIAVAQNEEVAKEMIMKAEGCPERAIVKVTLIT